MPCVWCNCGDVICVCVAKKNRRKCVWNIQATKSADPKNCTVRKTRHKHTHTTQITNQTLSQFISLFSSMSTTYPDLFIVPGTSCESFTENGEYIYEYTEIDYALVCKSLYTQNKNIQCIVVNPSNPRRKIKTPCGPFEGPYPKWCYFVRSGGIHPVVSQLAKNANISVDYAKKIASRYVGQLLNGRFESRHEVDQCIPIEQNPKIREIMTLESAMKHYKYASTLSIDLFFSGWNTGHNNSHNHHCYFFSPHLFDDPLRTQEFEIPNWSNVGDLKKLIHNKLDIPLHIIKICVKFENPVGPGYTLDEDVKDEQLIMFLMGMSCPYMSFKLVDSTNRSKNKLIKSSISRHQQDDIQMAFLSISTLYKCEQYELDQAMLCIRTLYE
jgi:hypothetical protein